ncbi:MAG: hypothetical protein QOH74_1265 [Gaiellales bacterium]|nr:hypothetical protein [Gaiellales bacterium]
MRETPTLAHRFGYEVTMNASTSIRNPVEAMFRVRAELTSIV